MKTLYGLIALMLFGFSGLHGANQQTYLFVSTKGKDTFPGTKERPLASLYKAKMVVREMIQDGLEGDVTVFFRRGTYYLNRTEVFGLEDSPPHNFTVTYRAYMDETVNFSSGVHITGWSELQANVNGIPQQARNNIWVTDVPLELSYFKTLYDGENRLKRAKSIGFNTQIDPDTADKYTLYLPQDKIHNWNNAEDAEIVIIPNRPWVMNIVPVVSYDRNNRIMKTNVPVTYKMASPSQVRRGHFDETVWIENIFEALDEPGEWVFNYDQHLTIIERNIIKDCCGEGFITKGNNTIVNNIIINLMQYTPEGTRAFHDRGYLVLPWGEVDGSVIQRNIFVSYHANQTILTEGRRRGRPDPHLRDCQADYNIYFNTQNPDWAADYLRKHQAEGIEQHSVNANPMFYNMRKGDFQLEANSPALFRGFLPFNLNNAGLLSD